MAVPWGLVVFLVGIAYGWMMAGKQDKSDIFKRGLLWGLVAAIVVAILGYFFNVNPLGLGDTGFLSLFLSFVVLTVVFIIGVWIGDLIPGGRRAGGPRTGMRRV